MRLEVKHLYKTYKIKNHAPVVALDDVSLLFPETGLVFILGKSGSGKSTLLNVMGGLDSPDSGEIIINGKSSKDFTGSEMDSYRNTYLGFIFQEYNILSDFSVEENISLALELQHKKADPEAIGKILAEVDLSGMEKRKPNELSGGQKQRVAIARALVKDPKIIFADEPTGALDSTTGEAVFNTLKKLSSTRLVVCVSHDREFAEHFGDRVIEIKDGKVISDISKSTLPPKEISKGLSLVGDNLYRIEKGHLLTADDLNSINESIASMKEDAYLSLDPRVNKGLQEQAGIDGKGNRAEFFSTDNSKVKAGKGSFEVVKSSFGLGAAFKMGAKSLLVKPFRLILTILLSFTSFTFFGLAATMSRIDKTNVEAVSMSDGGTKFLNLSPDGSKGNGFGERTLEQAKKDFSEDAIPVLSNASIPFSLSSDPSNYYYCRNIDGLVYVSPDSLSSFNWSLEAGKLPEKEKEIAISDWEFASIKKFGMATLPKEEVSKNSVLGLELGNYTVVGILSTGTVDALGVKKYASLAEAKDNYDYSLAYEASSLARSMGGSLAFLSEEGFKKEKEAASSKAVYNSSYVSSFGTVSFLPSQGRAFSYFQKGKDTLEEGEVLASESTFVETLFEEENDSGEDAHNSYKIPSIRVTGFPYFDENGVYQEGERTLEGDLSDLLLQLAKEMVAGSKRRDYPSLDPTDALTFARNLEIEVPYSEDASGVKNYDFARLSDYDSYRILLSALDSSYPNGIYGQFDGKQLYRDEMSSSLKEARETLFPQLFKKKLGHAAAYYWMDFAANEYFDGFVRQNASSWWTDSSKDPSSYLGKMIEENPDYASSDLGQKESLFLNFLSDNAFSSLSNKDLGSIDARYLNSFKDGYGAFRKDSFPYSGLLENLPYEVRNYKEESSVSELKIVGIYYGTVYVVGDRATFLGNEKTMEELGVDLDTGVYMSLLIPTPNISSLRKSIRMAERIKQDYIDNDYSGFYWSISNPSYSIMDNILSMFGVLSKVFIYTGIVLLVFAMLLFYNFISISINAKRREIGILRAVGARGSDVFKIFYSESFIIAMINFLLSGIATLLLSLYFNSYVSGKLGMSFRLLNPGFVELLLILASALVSSFISSFLPVFKISRQKPVDAIREK